MAGIFAAVALFWATQSVWAASTSSFYVSASNGNDSWSGLLAAPNASSTDGPFKTITKAQNAMESSSSVKMVTLRAGAYSIASGLTFQWSDNGETWIAYSHESPVFDGHGTGGAKVTGVSNITFEGITFQNMAWGGIQFNGVTNSTFRWNNFLNCNTNCLSGGGVVNMLFDSNTINGQTSVDSAFKLWYGSSSNKVTHNIFQNCQGGGVNFATGATDPPINNNIVDRNILKNVNISSTDQGAIYMADESHVSTGNQITNNIVIGNGGGSLTSLIKAIYLDDLMSNVLVSGNVCSGCGQWAFQIHGGDHNTIVNNIFDLSSGAQAALYQASTYGDYGMTANTIEKNIIYFAGSAPPSLYAVYMNAGDMLPTDSGNMYYSANSSSIPNGQTVVDASPYNMNPEFSNPSSNNYTMPASSPAYMVAGFQALATDQGPVSGGPGGATASGVLTGAGNSSTRTVNLTTEGSIDWAHWGTTSATVKADVNPASIGAWSIAGNGSAIYYTNDRRAIAFTNGTVPRSATVNDGIYVNGQSGFTFSVAAGTAAHTLTVHVGGYMSSATFTAHLSDGSAPDYVDTTSLVNGQYDRNYTLNFRSASAGQTLTITWKCNVAGGNVTLNGAAIQY